MCIRDRSNAADAKGLLKMACRMDDPVIFMEHKSLYRQSYASSAEPDDEYLIPFGKSKIIQKGSELTIITWGAMVQSSIDAVNDLRSCFCAVKRNVYRMKFNNLQNCENE